MSPTASPSGGSFGSDGDDDEAAKLVNQVVDGRYRVLRLLGVGGMGTVWEGVNETFGTAVAIKFIRPRFAKDPEARARFEIEARAAARLNTRHAVQVYDYGVTKAGLPYIVMEFLAGQTLSEAIIARGALPPREVGQIIGQAARALAKAHEAGIVHRDLKPDNIFLTRTDDSSEGLPYLVKLVDFGIAKILEDASDPQRSSDPADAAKAMAGPTRVGAVIGTPNFMAPEQLSAGGAPGPLTDLWSLGACAFASMTGRLPFDGDVLGEIVLKVCASPLPVPSKLHARVPRGFDAWFARACSRDPAKRFQTASELAQALADVCGLGRIRIGTLNEDQVSYVLSPNADYHVGRTPAQGLSPRTALLAGLVLGISIVIGMLGLLAWRDRAAAPAGGAQPASSTVR